MPLELGVHLPLIRFTGSGLQAGELIHLAGTARALGFGYLAAADHLLYGRPWVDGLTALGCVLPCSGDMTLVTSVALPVLRGPLPLANALGGLEQLSGGRLLVGLGAGASRRDFAAAGVRWEERWPRFDESVALVRALLTPGAAPSPGRYYPDTGLTTEAERLPSPRPSGPPVWIGSWGSAAAAERVARLGDGWIASAFNATPEEFAAAWSRLQTAVGQRRDPAAFGNSLSSAFVHVTDQPAQGRRVLDEVLAPGLGRRPDELRGRVLVGSVEQVADTVGRYRDAGVQRLFLWPVTDEADQLHAFADEVLPRLGADRPSGRPARPTGTDVAASAGGLARGLSQTRSGPAGRG